MLFCFFRILIYVYFCQKLYEENIIFNTNFQNSFQEVVCILQNIKMWNLVILRWQHFQYKAKFEKKKYFLFMSEIGIWFEKVCKQIVIENFKLVSLSPTKMVAL